MTKLKQFGIKLRIIASVIMGAASITALAYLPEGIGIAFGRH